MEHFIASLKLSWVRRIIQGYKKWQHGFYVAIEKHPLFWKVGAKYMDGKLGIAHNPFWKDLFNARRKFNITIQKKTAEEILCEPLWYHHELTCQNTNWFVTSWAKRNVLYIKDIIQENGTPIEILP